MAVLYGRAKGDQLTGKTTLAGSNRLLRISVTRTIIDRAEQSDSSHCMIADAIRAALPEVKSVSVDLASIRFTDPAKRRRYVYLTPRPVQQHLVYFDQGRHVEPFTFQLKQAVQVVESGYRTKEDGTRKDPSTAVQKVVGASNRRQPTKLGGKLPPRGPISSVPSKPSAAAPKLRKPAAKKMTAAEQKTVAITRAKDQAAARDRGVPTTDSNVALVESPGKVRVFGLKQLQP